MNMKCEVCRDLLPMYIDGLTSGVTNQEVELHMDQCDRCREVYEDMSSAATDEITEELQIPKKEEIDYLKKFRKKLWKYFVSSGVCFVLMFVGMIYTMGMEQVPSSDEVRFQYNEQEDFYYINGEWVGNALSDVVAISSESYPIHEDGEYVGIENIHKIRKVLIAQNPFDAKKGSIVSSGTSKRLWEDSGIIVRDVFIFSDKNIVFENGKLMK